MQESQTTFLFAAVLLPVLHTGIAAYLLIRNADKIAEWKIRLHRAVLGQFAVFIVALALAAGFVAANSVVSLISIVESFLVAPVLFLLFCWIGQDRLISFLSTYRGRRKFLHPWKLRRICLATMVQMIFYYICLSLIALGAITYAEWTKPISQMPTAHKLAHQTGVCARIA